MGGENQESTAIKLSSLAISNFESYKLESFLVAKLNYCHCKISSHLHPHLKKITTKCNDKIKNFSDMQKHFFILKGLISYLGYKLRVNTIDKN